VEELRDEIKIGKRVNENIRVETVLEKYARISLKILKVYRNKKKEHMKQYAVQETVSLCLVSLQKVATNATKIFSFFCGTRNPGISEALEDIH
jgi:hypothetical protein